MGDSKRARRVESLPGVYIHRPRIFPDDRGHFAEAFKASALAEAGGQLDLRQANVSFSRRGTIRGMHYTLNPPGQAKYVMCAAGRIVDVILDYERNEYMAVELSSEERTAVFVPENYAHGFIAVEDSTVFYLTSCEYQPDVDRGLSPMRIDWQELAPSIDPADYILSEKDREAE
ncbi:MAG: dTDP-4-dehydrorhamnose 3,5-epimerase family protein [Corynebacterium sp.]|nr:dTDP-4-dehydrorhamnose 3,5-epimerase family protein [Corynebacterium sp.]